MINTYNPQGNTPFRLLDYLRLELDTLKKSTSNLQDRNAIAAVIIRAEENLDILKRQYPPGLSVLKTNYEKFIEQLDKDYDAQALFSGDELHGK